MPCCRTYEKKTRMPCCRTYGPCWAAMVHVSGALVRRMFWYLLFAGYRPHWLPRWARITIPAFATWTLSGGSYTSLGHCSGPGSFLWDRRMTWMLLPLVEAYRIDPQKRSSFQLASCRRLTAQDVGKPWNDIQVVGNESQKDLFRFLKGHKDDSS